MNRAVLAEVRRLASQGRVVLTRHVRVDRAYRFGGIENQVIHALTNARSIRASRADQSSDWVVTGPDMDGDDLDCAIIVEGDVIVVTIF